MTNLDLRLAPYLLLVVVLGLVPSSVRADEAAPWQKAGELMKAAEYVAGLEEADRALAEHPDDLVLLRIKGVCLMELGREDEAVAVLRRAVEKDPSSIASWYYLAQALAYRGSVVEAVEILRTICKKAPDSDYAQLARQVLPDLEKLVTVTQTVQDKRRWNVTLRLGGEFDDNVPARTKNAPASPPIESFRLVTSAYLEARPLDQNIDSLPLTLGGGYSIYQSFHERDSLSDFDLTSQSVRLFARHAGRCGPVPYGVEVHGEFSDAQLGGDSFSTAWGTGVNLDAQWLEWTVTTLQYKVLWSDFAKDGLAARLVSRDGMDQTVEITQTFYALSNQLVMAAGYMFRDSDTEGATFELDSHGANASVQVALPWKLRFATQFHYQSDDYTDFTPAPTRLDDVFTVSVALSRPLWRENLFAEATFAHTTADSTQSFAELERNVFGLAITYAY